MNVWLDDIRPAPEGWYRTKHINEIKDMLVKGEVDNLSLDNDLGFSDICSRCEMLDNCINCNCFCHIPHPLAEGYKLVDWMEENNCWPKNKPTVHSNNVVAKRRMEAIINKHYDAILKGN